MKENVEAITKFPRPKTVYDLRSFLGMTGPYRRFIKAYAEFAKTLPKIPKII